MSRITGLNGFINILIQRNEQKGQAEKVHLVESVDMTSQFWKNVKAAFGSFNKNAPKDLILFRKQLAKLAIGDLPETWSNFVSTEQVDHPRAALIKAGMASATAYRTIRANFGKTSRTSTVVNDQNLILKFQAFLCDNSDLAHRVRDSYLVPGSDERERARILKKPWDRLFEDFNDLLKSEGSTEVSKSCLRKIRRKNCKHFRQAAKHDVEYAMCSSCTKIDLMLAAIQKNRYLRDWQINMDALLAESVCDSGNNDCLWDKCSNCCYDRVVLKIQNLIPNFATIKNQMINYPELVKYKKNQSMTHKWIHQVSNIEEFTSELASTLFCSKTKATGSKVSNNMITCIVFSSFIGDSSL